MDADEYAWFVQLKSRWDVPFGPAGRIKRLYGFLMAWRSLCRRAETQR